MATTRRMSGGETAVLVVSVLLLLGFAVLAAVRFAGEGRPGAGTTSDVPTAAASAGGTPTSGASGTSAGPPEVDLSAVTWDFASPSGNIVCSLDGERALCGIADHTYTVPAGETKACDGSVGNGLEVTAEGATLVCDTSAEPFTVDTTGVPALAYGEQLARDGFTCVSEETGVTCTEDENGYAFTVRRSAYSVTG